MSVPFYRAFEDRYRGSREDIKTRLGAYLPFLAPLTAWPHAAALDLGCGRGEWLELLGEQGFAARGIDLDEGMLAACRERGLAVRNLDALAALRAEPDGSLALVSAFHLVEHIPFEMVRELVAEALRVLQPGGLLVLETPNPENLVVGACDFYMDPTHERPIPPKLLGFVADHGGFARHKLVRLQEDPQLHGDSRVVLAAVLQGASPDYSVVAQKGGAPAQLAPFNAVFRASYGIDMQQLALRYQRQRDDEHAEMHQILGRFDQRIANDRNSAAQDAALLREAYDNLVGSVRADNRHLQDVAAALAANNEHVQALQANLHAQENERQALAARLDQSDFQLGQRSSQLEQRSEQFEQRSEQFEQRMAQHEARLAQAEQSARQIADLLQSSSWRVTAPLRTVGGVARRLRSAQREGRLGGAVRRRLAGAVRRAALAVLRRPRLKRHARSVLALFPGLQRRLHRLVHRPKAPVRQEAVLHEAPPLTLDDLPPRAAQAYHALKQAQQARTNRTRNR